MSTSDAFTDAGGNVFLRGQEIPELRAIGFLHRHPCPRYAVAAVNIGEPFGCDCGGTVLMGWRAWWPFPDVPHNPAVIIDLGGDLVAGSATPTGDDDE